MCLCVCVHDRQEIDKERICVRNKVHNRINESRKLRRRKRGLLQFHRNAKGCELIYAARVFEIGVIFILIITEDDPQTFSGMAHGSFK